MVKPAVVTVRHPDYENDHRTFGEVKVVDIDLGGVDLRDDDTRAEWLASYRQEAFELHSFGYPEVAEYVESVLRQVEDGELP